MSYYNKNITFNNLIENNVIGVMAWNYPNNRNDISVSEKATYSNNTFLPNPITKQTEKDEFLSWQQKLQLNNIVLGPSKGGSTNPETPSTTGKITREYWSNVHSTNYSDIPTASPPTSISELTLFEAPSNVSDNYGQRVRGFVTAPENGQYTFWIAADDKAELYLSSTEDPASKVRIAFTDNYTYSREWVKYPSQQSAKIMLQAGKRYYIEALHIEGGGGDNLAVGWQLPSGIMERPIVGNRLSPYTTTVGTTAVASTLEIADVDINSQKTIAYPNPFSSKITLNFRNQIMELQQLVLLSPTGQVIYQSNSVELEDSKLELDLSGLKMKAGLYLIKYTDNQGNSNSLKVYMK
ncbi:PA14 domain-containing protein [Pontibacter sp. E15-1]|uniref:PA14 domain-containing protein n=1 Tax=Pontibacter sp. E15-1 TaxID=2919918 RepID=UPI001F4F9855|nr:PA14 domain-containing protein [Pontibacter sp. E15-1]MCJ8166739.1 PA14 domain-containing protein [Pontibacter sp. E15-1]